ncbi:MAG: hypothetical protein U0168_26130 [Nannocystaceae bacterium]
MIAWSSDSQDGSSTAVVARRYDATGAAQGAEFLVNSYSAGAQNNPAVALNADGDFMIAWVSANQDGNLTGVYAQRYDQAGAAVGVEFRVNTTTANFQEEPDITVRGADEPIVTYSSGSASDRNVFSCAASTPTSCGGSRRGRARVAAATGAAPLLAARGPASPGHRCRVRRGRGGSPTRGRTGLPVRRGVDDCAARVRPMSFRRAIAGAVILGDARAAAARGGAGRWRGLSERLVEEVSAKAAGVGRRS